MLLFQNRLQWNTRSFLVTHSRSTPPRSLPQASRSVRYINMEILPSRCARIHIFSETTDTFFATTPLTRSTSMGSSFEETIVLGGTVIARISENPHTLGPFLTKGKKISPLLNGLRESIQIDIAIGDFIDTSSLMVLRKRYLHRMQTIFSLCTPQFLKINTRH